MDEVGFFNLELDNKMLRPLEKQFYGHASKIWLALSTNVHDYAIKNIHTIKIIIESYTLGR